MASTPNITHARLLQLLDYDPETGIFTNKIVRGRAGIGSIVGAETTKGYIYIQIDGERIMAHRLAWFYMNKEWPEGQIDHRNTIPDDNRWKNLREATPAQNVANSKGFGASGIKGVRRVNSKFQARIATGKKSENLGSFNTVEEAEEAYRKRDLELRGEFSIYHKEEISA